VPQAVECLLLKWKPGAQIPIEKIYIQKQNHTKKTGEKWNIDKGKKKN
jgi:hypothetical protein